MAPRLTQMKASLIGFVVVWTGCLPAGADQGSTHAKVPAGFYLVTQDCSTTVGWLRPHAAVTTVRSSPRPRETRRCARNDGLVSCRAQIDVQGHLIDSPVGDSDNYAIQEDIEPSDELPIWRLASSTGLHDWVVISPGARTGVWVRSVNPPEGVGSIVCRMALATASDVDKIRMRRH
jgi:hypothetical protein